MKLLVIDMQKGIVIDELYSFEHLVKNIVKLIDCARKNKVEVIYVQHDDGEGSGFSQGDADFEIAEQVKPKKNEKIFVKTARSCFSNKLFQEYLEDNNESELMIVGLQTEFCIDATVKSAVEKGYKVYLPIGCNSTFDNDYLSGEKTVKFYNEWIWPGIAECISVTKAIKLLSAKK